MNGTTISAMVGHSEPPCEQTFPNPLKLMGPSEAGSDRSGYAVYLAITILMSIRVHCPEKSREPRSPRAAVLRGSRLGEGRVSHPRRLVDKSRSGRGYESLNHGSLSSARTRSLIHYDYEPSSRKHFSLAWIFRKYSRGENNGEHGSIGN